MESQVVSNRKRRDAHLNAGTHNKCTRVPTVARWKMGFRKARFRNEEQVKGQERRWGEFPVYSDRSSYNRAAPPHRKSKSAEEGGPDFPGFLMSALAKFISGNKI